MFSLKLFCKLLNLNWEIGSGTLYLWVILPQPLNEVGHLKLAGTVNKLYESWLMFYAIFLLFSTLDLVYLYIWRLNKNWGKNLPAEGKKIPVEKTMFRRVTKEIKPVLDYMI